MRASLKWLLLAALLITLFSCSAPTNVPINQAPRVSLISPQDGAQVAVLASTRSVTLKFTATDPEGQALTFEVYLGTSASNLSKIATVNRPEYILTNLTPGQTYYWKVVVSDGNNSVESPVWSIHRWMEPRNDQGSRVHDRTSGGWSERRSLSRRYPDHF